MAAFHFEIVRPDKLLHEGEATQAVIISGSGEIGILPGHAHEICTLGGGVMRVEHEPNEAGANKTYVVIKGGYAEIAPDHLIVLANHARDIDDIYAPDVEATKKEVESAMTRYPKKDSRRAYYEEKLAWCELLLSQAKQPNK